MWNFRLSLLSSLKLITAFHIIEAFYIVDNDHWFSSLQWGEDEK